VFTHCRSVCIWQLWLLSEMTGHKGRCMLSMGQMPWVACLLQMLALRYMAIASFSRGSGSTPKLVALLANQEVQDEGGAQVGRFCHHASSVPTDPPSRMPAAMPSYSTVRLTRAEIRLLLSRLQIDPPGLYMVQLPFLDDIRHPEIDPAWVGEGHPTPDQEAVDAAAEMVAALSLPDFFSGMLPNPSLQRHYQVRCQRSDWQWLLPDPAQQHCHRPPCCRRACKFLAAE
jgi:Ku70/Ku80 beta-barrel domain